MSLTEILVDFREHWIIYFSMPLVAAFETGFHQTIPAARQAYAIPQEWAKLGVRRYGFHGASHRYIAERTDVLTSGPLVLGMKPCRSCSHNQPRWA